MDLHSIYPNMNVDVRSAGNLRLILGIGRSGTTWISNTLSKTVTPCRFYEEPLYHIKPKLELSAFLDHTSIPFDDLSKSKKLGCFYSLLSSRDVPADFLSDRHYKRKDDEFDTVIVKEVHSLLATKYIIESLDVPVLLIVRNVLDNVDSILSAQGVDGIYLRNEYEYLWDENFLSFVFGNQGHFFFGLKESIDTISSSRIRRIISLILVCQIMQFYFNKLSKTYRKVLMCSYDDILKSPDSYFVDISEFFGVQYMKGNHIFNTSSNYDVNDPYTICRPIEVMRKPRTFKSLETVDLDQCKNFFKININSIDIDETFKKEITKLFY